MQNERTNIDYAHGDANSFRGRPDLIHIENDGPLIVRTNYWDSELARAGEVYVSVNAGTIRVLLPRALAQFDNMHRAPCRVLSRSPWPAERREEAVEILFDLWGDFDDDEVHSPFALTLTPESFDLLPEPRGLVVAAANGIWRCGPPGRRHAEQGVRDHLLLGRVDELPCLEPWMPPPPKGDIA